MQYLLLIYRSESEMAKLSSAEMAAMYGEYGKFTQEITDSGNYVGGNPLKPTTTATTVRVRDAKRVVTDGPFAETKEQLGGYYLIEAKDLDQAISIAARIPGARVGSIEVRPIMPRTQAVQA
ncbi:MAG TPA: YciI family protein [Candidatus Acidoferrum sp.]